ncbi:uncharacterized protein LOC103514828 isoform X8 [Diaphorina citri]|uniref:Uncharacterized protein LOC103514828 isoform X8 n=1 Tax=Diaphorina citri TaxID=121845 RepID=A0A3Q0J924_DIACI|nr:uncharacterized protein LOC103514828 isoform X8 [Diaphorina citri]
MGGTTADNSFDNIHDTMIPILKKWFGDSLHYIYMRPSHSREKDLDDWGIPQGSQYRPTMVKLFIVSPRFANKTVDERHAMVHEALRDEMLKREAGCAIDIHADTPEEWNDFRANNDFDEISGKPDLRLRAAKTTPVSVKDVKLRDKIYNYIAKHFSPTVLHVVDSKKMHPIDNDNPAFDVLIVSNHFNNLTITQRTMLMHDYLRDFINEGVQFRLHALQSPEEVWPDRFNEDGFEANRLIPVHNVREHLNVYKEYVPPPTHVVELNHLMANKLSIIDEAKRKIREEDLKLLREYDKKKKQTEVG